VTQPGEGRGSLRLGLDPAYGNHPQNKP